MKTTSPTSATSTAVATTDSTSVHTSGGGAHWLPDHQQQRQDSSRMATPVREEILASTKTLHRQLGIPEHMDWRQIELIYRAEGNANLVLALPQFKKVLRLPKMLVSSSRNEVEEQQQTNAEARVLTMAEHVAYIRLIRCLLGSEFIFEADVIRMPNELDRMWINAHIKEARPAHRLNKEFCGQFGLLLPDVTQLPIAFDILLSNLQPNATLAGETFAIEIKPKQGWRLPNDVDDLFDAAPTQAATPPEMPKVVDKCKCRYCAMQFLKLKSRKISHRSAYCPMELFSGVPGRMLNAMQALFECPQNNLRVFCNGELRYGDHGDSLSWQDLREKVFKGEMLQLIKDLLVETLLRDYATTALADADVVLKADAGQPHSSAAPQAVDAERTPPPIRTDNRTTASPSILEAAGGTEAETAEAKATQTQINGAELLCLPKNCVLQKILHLQLLAKHNLRHMAVSGFAQRCEKSYKIVEQLLNEAKGINFCSLHPTEAYILGATALDCSIMVTFREVLSWETTRWPQTSNVVHLPNYGRSFLTKVSLLDLDPKPDSHFQKYLKQTREAYECMRNEKT